MTDQQFTASFDGFQSDIIGRPPGNLTRFGISVVFAFVVVLMVFAWLIDYSDAIKARLVINSSNPAINVMAEHHGTIDRILTESGRRVRAGDAIVVFQSDSDSRSVDQLKRFLQQDFTTRGGLTIEGNLGSLRLDYHALQNDINQYQRVKSTLTTAIKTEQLELENQSLASQLDELRYQSDLYAQKDQINEAQYQRSLSLSAKKLITQNDLGHSQSGLIDARLSASQVGLEIKRIMSTMERNRRTIQLYELESEESQADLIEKIRLRQQILLDRINAWERKYIIKAPISGLLSIPNDVFVHQNVLPKQGLFTISPDVNELVGQIKISEHGAGKIKVGQAVDVMLDSYPYQEFGKLAAVVLSKSQSVHDQFIYVEIEIIDDATEPGQLITSYNKTIPYMPNMQGTVEIITSKKNILSRVFEQFAVLFN